MKCHNFTQNASNNLLFQPCVAEPIAIYVNRDQSYTHFYRFFDSSILPILNIFKNFKDQSHQQPTAKLTQFNYLTTEMPKSTTALIY